MTSYTIALAVHFEALQTWEQLKQFFTASYLSGGYIDIKKSKKKKQITQKNLQV